MDYYKVLGLDKNATKPEIKDAFRKLAMKFHPDKHTASSKSIKDTATLRFKQVSEAYDVLSDDRKRSDYNLRHSGSEFGSSSRATGSGYGYGHSSRTSSSSSSYSDYNNSNRYGYESKNRYHYTSYRRASYLDEFAFKVGVFVRYLNTREFLLHAAFVGVILGGAIFIEGSRDVLWKLQNSGKSFEDAMDSIEKAKTEKDKE